MRRASGLAILASALIVPHAHGAAYTGVVLYRLATPAGFTSATLPGYPMTAAGGQAVGYGTTSGGASHALLWSSSAPATDLNQSGLNTSIAYGTVPGGSDQTSYQQCGSGSGPSTNNQTHAMIWLGTATSAVDMNPTNIAGINTSEIFGLGGGAFRHAGYGSSAAFGVNTINPTGYNNHAIVWTDSASNTAIDLNPTNLVGYTNSIAFGTAYLREVGYAYGSATGGNDHAMLWLESAGSAVDLNPTNIAGFTSSAALYTTPNNQQVGFGYGSSTNANDHALLWSGSGNTAVDLNPLGFTSSSANRTNGVEQLGAGYKPGDAADAHALLWYGSANSALQLEGLLPSTGAWTSSIANTFDASGNAYGTATGTYNGVSGTYAVEWTPTSTVSGVTVAAGQTYHFVVNTGTGILVETIPGVAISAGGTTVVDPATVHANRQLIVVTDGGLVLAGAIGQWTALLNLSNNDLDLTNASLATVTDQIRQGYANGTWAGTGGITSTSAAADPKHLTALGVVLNNEGGTPLFSAANLFDGTVVSAGDVLVKYTYYGDANLDGKVDGSDYSLIDAGYASHGSLTGWYYGDFNYDGVIDGSDYTLIDNASNNQTVNLSSAALVAASTAQVAATPAAVPEPGSLTLAAVGCLALLGRRRRQ
jgi:hypothetical protein